MYRYETHMHTSPVSKCAKASVQENLEFYKRAGYDGIFITNHFLDGNVGFDKTLPYREQLDLYFSAVDEGEILGKALGLQIFWGVEMTHGGTDFLIYGLPRSFYYEHPEIMEMDMRSKLAFLMEQGAFIIQAHPYREAHYIDHIRLYPRSIHGVEVINANRKDLENRLADIYADAYGLLKTAGTDNHAAGKQVKLAGMECEQRLTCCEDYIAAVKEGRIRMFTWENDPAL